MLENLKHLNYINMADIFAQYHIPVLNACNNLFVKGLTKIDAIIGAMNYTHEEFIAQCEIILNNQKKKFKEFNNFEESFGTLHVNLLLRSLKYFEVFSALGSDLSIHIMTKCSLICKVDDYFIIVSGNIQNKKTKILDSTMIKPRGLNDIEFKDKINTINFFHAKSDYLNAINAKLKIKLQNLKIYAIYKSLFLKNQENIYEENKFVNAAIENKFVGIFLFIISKKLFQKILGFKNMKILKEKINKFVNLYKKESIVCTEIYRGFKLSTIYLFKGYDENIFKNFIKVIFDELFSLLINRFFYCTEASFAGNKYLFYAKEFWKGEEKAYMTLFLKNFYEVIESEIQSKILKPKLRLIPKKESLRPVFNNKTSYLNSNNNKLRVMQKIIDCAYKNQNKQAKISKDKILEDVYKYGISNKESFIYMVKIDFKNCFDTIQTERLLIFLEELLTESIYYLRTYQVINLQQGKILKLNKYTLKEPMTPFHIFLIKSFFEKQRFYKDGLYYSKTSENIINFIQNELKDNSFMHNNKFYKRFDGIAQGSIISSTLCNIYLSNVEKEIFSDCFKCGKIFRYIDDILFMTPNIREIDIFFEKIKKFCYYGLKINENKIATNFDLKNINNNNEFVTWCGYKIFGDNFGIKLHFNECSMNSFVYDSQNPGLNLADKISWNLNHRLRNFLIDKNNRFRYQNIYEIMLLYYRRILYCYQKMPFVNSESVKNTLIIGELCVKRKCKKNKILDFFTVDGILEKAKEKSGVLKINKK